MVGPSCVTGTVVVADGRSVDVLSDDGRTLNATVPLKWFTARGMFDCAKGLPLGLRVRVRLSNPPKGNRLVAVLESSEN
jgi:hypothetical protein